MLNIKQHAEDFIRTRGIDLTQDFHGVLRSFATFVEGKQAEADAVALLQSRGYSVLAPSASASSAPARAE